MTELVMPGVWAAEVRQGRWLAFCSHRDVCDAAAALQPFADGFFCPECGRDTAVVWPSADMVAGIERLLMMRPHWKNRNWLPGETLIDLAFENGAHGILSGPDLPELAGQSLLTLTEDRILLDRLPVTSRRPLKAIGD